MPSSAFVLALLRPKAGKESALDALLHQHVPLLRTKGLATSSPDILLRSADGTRVQIYEWASKEAADLAHKDPDVLGLWNGMTAVAEVLTLADLPEATHPFPNFSPLGG